MVGGEHDERVASGVLLVEREAVVEKLDEVSRAEEQGAAAADDRDGHRWPAARRVGRRLVDASGRYGTSRPQWACGDGSPRPCPC